MNTPKTRDELRRALADVAVALPDILLPRAGTDLTKFAVVACDQYTSQPDYWAAVEALVGDAPSALRLMLPELYLEQPGLEQRIEAVNETMRSYLSAGLLQSVGEGFVYLHRHTSTGLRKGLVVALDLECYDFSVGSSSLIRATESTILERLPPRVNIRRNAPLELPHIMVLVDDPQLRLFGLLERARESLPTLYDFELMQSSGHIKGWKVDQESLLWDIAEALAQLKAAGQGLLFAMGDGNHSLATAKTCWEALKPTLSPEQQATHPARYALCELVNLHDEGLVFEPIHRVLFGVSERQLSEELGIDLAALPPLQQLQPLLDRYLEQHPEVRIDYVHGEADALALGEQPDNVALIMPEFDKASLYPIVRDSGVLVRKSFSMGEAPDKRFYLESRLIVPEL